MLLSIGLVMLLSASSLTSLQEYDNSYKYFLRQLVFAVLGLIAMYFISRIDYRIYKSSTGCLVDSIRPDNHT